MAYTRKTTDKKTTTKAKPVEVEEVTTVEEATQAEEDAPAEEKAPVEEDTPVEEKAPAEEKVVVVEKKKFRADDTILCRSIAAGKLVMIGAATGMVYRWPDYGSEAEVEYKDLASAVRAHSGHVYEPYFIIEDEDFVDEFVELKKFYKEKFTIRELTDILLMDDNEMENKISILPKGAREQLINIVSTKISTGELDSVRKIKTLERILGVDFSLVAEMQ